MSVVRVTAADETSLIDGFYSLERDHAGSAFRWTGPSRQFRIRVEIDRRVHNRAVLTLLASESKVNLSTLQCAVDGTYVDVEKMPGDYPHRYRFPLPPRRRGLTPTVIAFVAQETICPKALGYGEDTRSLGVIFQDLTISTAERQA